METQGKMIVDREEKKTYHEFSVHPIYRDRVYMSSERTVKFVSVSSPIFIPVIAKYIRRQPLAKGTACYCYSRSSRQCVPTFGGIVSLYLIIIGRKMTRWATAYCKTVSDINHVWFIYALNSIINFSDRNKTKSGGGKKVKNTKNNNSNKHENHEAI